MKQKVVWMSWINWFVHTVVNVRHRDGLSRSLWTRWTLLNTMHWFCGLLLFQTGSKAGHTAGDCFCTSWQHTTPWSRVCTFQNTEIFGSYKTWAYTEMRTPIRNHITAATCLHHWVVWVTATLRIDVDDATCDRERKSRRRENATHVECRSASSTCSCVMTACLTCAEGGDDRPLYQWMGRSRVWLLPR